MTGGKAVTKHISQRINQPPLRFFHFSATGSNKANIRPLYTRKSIVNTMVEMPIMIVSPCCTGDMRSTVWKMRLHCRSAISTAELRTLLDFRRAVLRVKDWEERRRVHGGLEPEEFGEQGGEMGSASARAVEA